MSFYYYYTFPKGSVNGFGEKMAAPRHQLSEYLRMGKQSKYSTHSHQRMPIAHIVLVD